MKKTLCYSLLAVAIFCIGLAAHADAPASPANVTATSTAPTRVDLSWTASAGAVGYQIFRDSTSTPIATTTATSYSDLGLAPNTAHTYYLTAYDASNTISALTAGVAATTRADMAAPSVPSGLTATPASSTQINLAWSASTDDVAVTGYVVYRNGSAIATTTNLSYNDTGLAASSTNSYSVEAFDAAGNYSALSSAVSATSQNDAAAPSVPIGLTATPISNSQINLSWSPATDNLGVSGYRVYRNSNLIGTATTTSYSDTGLTASTTYLYAVSAIDAAGNDSGQCTSINAVTPWQQPSTPPIWSGTVRIGIANGGRNGKQINLRSNEIIKLTVYSDKNVNVRNIDNSTVRFAGAKALGTRFGFWGQFGLMGRSRMWSREYQFRAREMTDLVNGDTSAIFTAKLKNGSTIGGTVNVRVVNSKKNKIVKRIEQISKNINKQVQKLQKTVSKMQQNIANNQQKLNVFNNKLNLLGSNSSNATTTTGNRKLGTFMNRIKGTLDTASATTATTTSSHGRFGNIMNTIKNVGQKMSHAHKK